MVVAVGDVTLAVVGGGISGLAAAWGGARRGADVTVLEASDRAGGVLATSPLGDFAVYEAADAFLARVPEAVDLCRELGLGDDLVAPATGSVYVWSEGALRRRLGDGVLDRLVAPLVGGIWAGDCDRLSLRTATPVLAAARDRGPSLLRA